MSKGYIYILSNPAMPGLLKIGKSTRGGGERAEELFRCSSGVPMPFRVEFEIMSRDIDADERWIHDQLQRFRVNQSREFFRVEIDVAIAEVVAAATHEFDVYVVDGNNYIDPGDAALLTDMLQMLWPDVVGALCEMTMEEAQEIRSRFKAKRKLTLKEFYGRDDDLPGRGDDL